MFVVVVVRDSRFVMCVFRKRLANKRCETTRNKYAYRMIIKRVCRATSCKRIIADSRVVRSRRLRRRVSPHSRSGCLMPRAVTTRIKRAQTTRLRKNTVNYTQYTSCRANVDTYTYILYNIYIIYWIGCPSNEKFTNSAYGGRAMRFAAYIV